jgi:hypothetical protein
MKHKVSRGDSIPSIAKDNGFFWETIWNHGENADLKAKRQNPNQLVPGDEVFVPEPDPKKVSKSTDAKHEFVRRGEPHKLKLQLKMLGEPRANEAFVLDLDGELIEGQTDGDGKLEQLIPGNARGGRLILQDGKEIIPIRIGNLDPVDVVTGVQQRLNNIGFRCGAEGGELNEATQKALRLFQEAHKLTVSGEADDATKAKLRELHP